MKQLLRFIAFIILPVAAINVSCTKTPFSPRTIYSGPSVPNNPPPSSQGPRPPLAPIPPVTDSLSGHEYLYSSLVWQVGTPTSGNGVNSFIKVPASDLFLGRGIEVFMDSAGTWIDIPFYTFEYPAGTFQFPANNGFVYDNNWFDALYIFGIASNNSSLAGTTVGIKVRVL